MSQRIIDDPAAAGWEFDSDTGYWMWKGEEGTGGGGSIQDGDTEGQITTWDGDEWTPEGAVVVDASGKVLIGGAASYNGTGQLQISDGVNYTFEIKDGGSGGVTLGGTSGTGNMLFQTNGTEAMLIDADGKVGIGAEPLPQHTLYVSGDDATVAAFDHTGAGSYIKMSGSEGSVFVGQEAGGMVLQTNGATRLNIDADGDVSIGGINPTAKLHVSVPSNEDLGPVTIKLGGPTSNSRTASITKDTTTREFEIHAATGSSKSEMVFYSNNSEETMRISKDGRVDITGSLYVNGTPKVGTVDLINAFSKLRDAVKDEDTVEALKESITNCIGGLIEEWESMQATLPAGGSE
jgi:hypothetical protein